MLFGCTSISLFNRACDCSTFIYVPIALAEIRKGGMLHGVVVIRSINEPDDAIILWEKYGSPVEFVNLFTILTSPAHGGSATLYESFLL